MKILYITQTFHPEMLATERQTQQALALRRLGHEVTVLTTMPSYPLGRTFEGYRGRFLARETIGGVRVVRVWSLPASNRSTVRRCLSYASFCLFAMLVGLVLGRCDLVIAAVPNPGTELAGIVISKLKRIPLLLELVDVLPENLPLIGISETGPVGRVLALYYRIACRLADAIAVLCPAARDTVVAKGIDAGKIVLMPNAADQDLLKSIPAQAVRTRYGLDGKFVVAYAGSFSRYYQVPNLVAAAKLLRESHPEVHWLLLGQGPQWEQVRREIEECGLGNVTLAGLVPRAELGGHLQAADLFVFSMVGDPMPRPYHGILTAKACDYLLIGKPIIAVERGEILAPLLRRIGAGEHVSPGDASSLAAAVAAFAADPQRARACGQAAADYAARNLLRDAVIKRFMDDLAGCLARQGIWRSDGPAAGGERQPEDLVRVMKV